MSRSANGLPRLRAWWFRRQGFGSRHQPKTVVDCLRRSGWFPTAGSTGVYISMRARIPRITRESVDRAVLDGVDVIEIPGAHARPPVLVPRDDLALALRLHYESFRRHAAPTFARGRYSEAAFRAVADHACRALDEGPLSTAEIRARVTHADAGELLTWALGDLAVRGIVRRYPADGRLDSPKYLYELRHVDDRPNLAAEGDAAVMAVKATRLFLSRYGPATAGEIADWAALTKGRVRRALTILEAEPVQIDGWVESGWLLSSDVNEWNGFRDGDRHVVLLAYRDPFVSLRRPQSVLTDRIDAPVLNAQQRRVTIGDVAVLHNHVVVAGGELVGVWEYDPDTRRVVTRLWKKDKKLRADVAEAARKTERFIREQLGDAKLSAVDPPARRAKRIAFCSDHD